VADLADAPSRQKGEAHQPLSGIATRGFNQEDEPTIFAAEARYDRARDLRRPSHAGLRGFHHPGRALKFWLSGVRHMDFDQVVGHGRHGRWLAGGPHREEHRAGT
jgi:hypothetical protein